MEWLLTALAVAGMMFLTFLSSHQHKSWLAPSALFNAFWAVVLVMQLVFARDFDFRPLAAWFVLFLGITFHVGNHFGYKLGGHSLAGFYTYTSPRNYCLRGGIVILVLCTILGLLAVPPLLTSRGYTVANLLQLESIAQMARDFSGARYMDQYVPPASTRYLLTFIFLGALFGGVWLATAQTRSSRLLAFIPLLPAALIALIQTTRAQILFFFILEAGSYCATLMLRGDRVRIRACHLLVIGLILAVVIGAYLALQMLRDQLTPESISIALAKAKAAIFGSPAAFSQWLEREWYREMKPAWGAFTLAGVFDRLGLAAREQGLYTEFTTLGAEGRTSNIYTVFRGLIQDFTLPGALLVWLLAGVGAGISYRKVIGGGHRWLPLLTLCYVFVFFGYICSPMTYNTVFLALLMFIASLSPIVPRPLRPLYLRKGC